MTNNNGLEDGSAHGMEIMIGAHGMVVNLKYLMMNGKERESGMCISIGVINKFQHRPSCRCNRLYHVFSTT
jgi:hypothetical protein